MSANIPANTDGGLLTAGNCTVVFIDYQPQMTFGVANIDRHREPDRGLDRRERTADLVLGRDCRGFLS